MVSSALWRGPEKLPKPVESASRAFRTVQKPTQVAVALKIVARLKLGLLTHFAFSSDEI